MLKRKTACARRGATNHRLGLAATMLLAGLALPPLARGQLAPPMPPHAAGAALGFSQSNVPAEASAADAVQAKDRAFAAGRRVAWQALATQAGYAGSLSDQQIDDLVASIIVEQERISAGRYSGRLTVNFAPDRVRALLAGQPVAPAPGMAQPALPAAAFVEATATYRSMAEWLELRRRLLASAPVASVEVQAIAVDAARLRLGLRAAPAQAAGDLAVLGVALQPGSGMMPGDAWRVGLAGGG